MPGNDTNHVARGVWLTHNDLEMANEVQKLLNLPSLSAVMRLAVGVLYDDVMRKQEMGNDHDREESLGCSGKPARPHEPGRG